MLTFYFDIKVSSIVEKELFREVDYKRYTLIKVIIPLEEIRVKAQLYACCNAIKIVYSCTCYSNLMQRKRKI